MAAKQVVVTKYITTAAPSLRGKPRLTPRLIYALESAEFVSQRSTTGCVSVAKFICVSKSNMRANFTSRAKNSTIIIFNVKLYIS